MHYTYFECRNCIFFVPYFVEMSKSDALGMCKRHAPQTLDNLRPEVSAHDFCGDHIRSKYPFMPIQEEK